MNTPYFIKHKDFALTSIFLVAFAMNSSSFANQITGQEFTLTPSLQQSQSNYQNPTQVIKQAEDQIRTANNYIKIVGDMGASFNTAHGHVVSLINNCRLGKGEPILGEFNKGVYTAYCEEESHRMQKIISNSKSFLEKHNERIHQVRHFIGANESSIVYAQDVQKARQALRLLEEKATQIDALNKQLGF